jgi:hypothetical protein
MKQQLILIKPRLLRAQLNGVSKWGEHFLWSPAGFKPRGRTQLVFALIWLCCLCIYRDSAAQDRIRIGISAISLGFLPTIIAEKKSFYAKHGIHSEHVLVPCAIATNALLSDDLDYAVCTGPGIAGAIKGLPIKLVMTTQDKLGYTAPGQSQLYKSLAGPCVRQNHRISTFGSPALADFDNATAPLTEWSPVRIIHTHPQAATNSAAHTPPWDGGKVARRPSVSPRLAGIFRRQSAATRCLLWDRDSRAAFTKRHGHNRQAAQNARPTNVKRYDQGGHRSAALFIPRAARGKTINIAAKWYMKHDVANHACGLWKITFRATAPDGAQPDQALLKIFDINTELESRQSQTRDSAHPSGEPSGALATSRKRNSTCGKAET